MAKEKKKTSRITVDKSAIDVFPTGPEGPQPPGPEMRKKKMSDQGSARPLDPRASKPLDPRASSSGRNDVSRGDFLKMAGMGGASLFGAILGLVPGKKKEKRKDEERE